MTQSTPSSQKTTPHKNKEALQNKQIKENGKVKKFEHKKFIIASLWLVGMGVIVLLGAFFWQYYEEETKETILFKDEATSKNEEQDIDGRVQKLEEENKALKATSERMEKIEKDFARSQGEMAALNTRLNALERDMQALNVFSTEMASLIKQGHVLSQHNTQGISRDMTEIKRIEARLEALEKLILLKRENEQKGFERIQALTQIREAVYRGQTFKNELNTLIQEIGPNEENIQEMLAQLKPFAARGLLTPMDLYLSFPDLADKMSLAVRPEPQNLSEKILGNLEELVVIRSIEESKIKKGSLDDSIVKIEYCLRHGDLRKALEIIKGLNPGVQKVAASWVQNARNYLEAESILNAIEALIVGRSFVVPPELEPKGKENKMERASQ